MMYDMTEKMNLAEMEKKIHGLLSNDGTLDILLGLFLLGLGLSLLLADMGFGISEEIMFYTIIPALCFLAVRGSYCRIVFFPAASEYGLLE
jgi:hypothetical protein